MAVLKNKTQGNYTIVSQNIMRDQNLSLTERGMLLTLLSLPDNWNLTVRGLCQILPDGKDKISKTLKSLIDKGYVTRMQSRSGGGKFDSTDLEVHESPVIENVSTEGFSPCPEKPDTVKPDAEKPCPVNPPQYINNKSNTNKSNTKRVCKDDTLTDAEYQNLVKEFGKAGVDYQIKRIEERGYRGCLNFDTIKKWCKERTGRSLFPKDPFSGKTSFHNYEQRGDYDYDELERLLVCN